MTTTPVDVVVIGAGSVGASVAYELALAGASVHVVEQGTRAAGGCSRANAGLLAPSHSEPLTGAGNIRTGLGQLLRPDSAFRIRPSMSLVPWLLRFGAASRARRVRTTTRVLRDLGSMSLRRHAEYVDHGVPTSFERRGLLDVFATGEHQERATESLARNPLDLAYDVLTPGDVRALVPGIAGVAGGIFFRDEAHCDSRVFVETTLAAAQARGARITLGSRVRAIRHVRGRIDGVETDNGVIPTRRVVVAAGHLSGALTRPLGLRLPLAPAKGYVIDLETRAGDPVRPLGLKEDLVVVTPYPDRIRLAGTLELVGRDTTLDPARIRTIRAAADRTLPRLRDRRTLSVWAGLRPCSADGLPMVGDSGAMDGLTVATGHGQQGLVLAPGTGRLIAEAITGATPSLPDSVRTALRPDRFAVGRG